MYYRISAEKPKLIIQPDGWLYFETPSFNEDWLAALKEHVPYQSRQWDKEHRAWLIRRAAISVNDLLDMIERTFAFRPEIAQGEAA